jgi:tRNA pseudouridine32 synthase/23S rRNA pseudouridine746 synthase
MAEFWQGESPKGEIRVAGQYYPACRGKCKPILEWMLQGLDVDEGATDTRTMQMTDLEICYQDEVLAVVSKPAGLLSVPGRSILPSVESLLRERFPGTEGPMMVHRLDMDTSGLMVVALTAEAYHELQRQFFCRTVAKRYVALLQSTDCLPLLLRQPRGRISLPLRPDPLDRPRQLVDPEGGKEAVTDYEVLSTDGPHPRLALTPLTGRTHQLRMHCAHQLGLGCPILGDALYGQRATRLYLHAERLCFHHPTTGEPMSFECPPPF